MNNLTARLRAAADYMTAHGWTQGTEQDDAGHVCLTGAIRYCAPLDGDAYLIREVLRRRDRAENWNDASDRDQGEVLTLLRTADITDADLADTFGPQWEQVVALVRRAANLSREEVHLLAAAWAAAWVAAGAAAGAAARVTAWVAAGDAARVAAGDAAWAAAGDAAGDAAGAAARDAAGAAARVAAGDAARDAAWAPALGLVVRDLIGQQGLTQAHYDTLTRPWRTVVGPLHPDDADLRAAS